MPTVPEEGFKAHVFFPVPGWTYPTEVDQESGNAVPVSDRDGKLDKRVKQQVEMEILKIVTMVQTLLAKHNFPDADAEKTVYRIRLVLEELVQNALRHGHQLDPNKVLRIDWRIQNAALAVAIHDEGEGFDVQKRLAYDPTAPENLEEPSGRGFLLVKSFTTSAEWSNGGRTATFTKALPIAQVESTSTQESAQ